MFIYIFLLLGLVVLYNGCTNDDEDVTIQTFLEKHDGTKRVNTTDGLIFFIRLNNNTHKFIETWLLIDDCYFYNSEVENMEITKKTQNMN